MRKVLVTGGAGFIGSHLCERLVAQGCEVFVLDDLSSGKLSNLAGIGDRIRLLHDDIGNILAYADSLRGVERIYHLAALISGYDSLEDPDAYVRTNVTGTLRLIELCRALDRPRVVFASSSTVYGNEGPPVRSESTPPRPLTMYALSKLVGEHMLAMYRDLAGYDEVCLRLFNVYGPRQSPDHPYANVTCKFSHAAAHGLGVKLYGDGEQSRDFVYVEDVVAALLRVGESTPERLYNVGSGTQRSINGLLELAQERADATLEVERLAPWPNDIRAIQADVSKLRDQLGLEPAVDLREGLRRTVEWFRRAAR